MSQGVTVVICRSTKVAAKPFLFLGFRFLYGYTSVNPPKSGLLENLGGVSVSLLLGIAGFAYAVLFLGFWSLGRMSAMTDKLVESRANVIPFRRS